MGQIERRKYQWEGGGVIKILFVCLLKQNFVHYLFMKFYKVDQWLKLIQLKKKDNIKRWVSIINKSVLSFVLKKKYIP